MKNLPKAPGTMTEKAFVDPAAANQRRTFLKKSAKLAVTAPAVTLLLTASLKPEKAAAKMYTYDPGPWIP